MAINAIQAKQLNQVGIQLQYIDPQSSVNLQGLSHDQMTM